MRSLSHNGPEWIHKKKPQLDNSTRFGETLTRNLYTSKPSHEFASQLSPIHTRSNLNIHTGRLLLSNQLEDKNRVAHVLLSNDYNIRTPIKHCRNHVSIDHKSEQVKQELELLNREHERLRRLLTQR